MTLESLCKVILPPRMPIETGSVEGWPLIEETLGVVLPSDYKQYIAIFGTGCFGNFLWPFNPFSTNRHLNLIEQINVTLNAQRALKEQWGNRQCPYPLYPEAGGLLPWGSTDNGDDLFWLTTGSPEDWIVVINEARAPVYEEYQESMTGLLAKLLSGEITSKIFPQDFPDKSALFMSRK